MFDCSSVKVKIDKQLTDQGFTGILLSLNSDGVKTFFSETDIYQTHVSRHEMSKIVWDLIDISRSAYTALFHHIVVAKKQNRNRTD